MVTSSDTHATKVLREGVKVREIVGLKSLDEAVDELNAVLQSNEAYGS